MIKIKPILFIILIFLAFGSFEVVGQTARQKAAIVGKNKVVSLNELEARFSREYKANHSKALKMAQQKGWPVKKRLPDGALVYLYGVDQFNQPLYVSSTNLNAAITTSTAEVQPGGDSGLDLTGEGLTIGMWEVARPLLTHQEFVGRMFQADNDTAAAVDLHSTHVGGTLIASGVNPDARGMAIEGLVDAYTADNDNAEMAEAAAQGLLMSNHSYGFITGWYYNLFGDGRYVWFGSVEVSETEDYRFGAYTENTQQWDQIAVDAPSYLIVKSAGNDRLEGPPAGTEHWFFNPEIDDWDLSTTTRDLDGGPDGYDVVGEQSTAKNILSIGAINDVLTEYTSPADVTMSSFSAFGPTDDGRIKPDIVANGVGLISSSNASNTSYSSISGTSMSAPNATGSLLLLQEHYEAINGSFMLAATLKGLVIHTAREAGSNPGPDYSFGHGLLNTAKAAAVISENNVSTYIREETLAQGDTYSFEVEWDGSMPLAATISWTDLPADSLTADLNDPTLRLINDLDIRISANGSTFEPWILDPTNPSAAATRGDNFRDNVEKILITDAAAGTYTVTVTHKNALAGGSQNFSLIISGEEEFTAPAIAVSPDAINATLEAGEIATEMLTIGNNGNDTLFWSLSIEEIANAAFAKMVENTLQAVQNGKATQAKITSNNKVNDTRYISGGILALENVVQYATGFEEFNLGELSGQQGWASTPGAYSISNENPANGSQHIRGVSNGEGANALAFSPEVGIGVEAVSSMSARINVSDTGTTWQIIPQSPSAGSVSTRIQFGPDNGIYILDATAGDYVPVDATIPSGYFDLSLTINRETAAMRLYIDGELIFEGTGFAGDIEEVVLFSLREGTSTMDVDDLQIIDGDIIGVDWISANPTSGTVAPGEEDVVDVELDATSLTAGLYEAIISIFSNDYTSPQVNVPVSVIVNQDGAAPNIAVAPDSLVEELVMGDTSVQELTVSNTGDGLLQFQVEIVQDGEASFAERVAMSKPFAVKAAASKNLIVPSYRRNSIPDQMIHGKGAFSEGIVSLATNLYATDFEELSLGDINGQDGWLAQYGNWTVSDENPAIGSQHFRGLADGLGESLAISPTVEIGDDEYSSMSALINMTGTGVTWSIAPQSPTAEMVVTRVFFEADGSATVLVADGEGAIVPIEAAVPEGYFDFGIEVNRSTSEFSVYFDQELVFSGTGFAGDIENVAIISDMELSGPTFDMDNFSIYDGRLDVNTPFSWLSVDPKSGTLNPGGSNTLEVTFDATQLEEGGYSAEIYIYSNDPDDSAVVVPVRLNVGEEKYPVIAVKPKFIKEKLLQDETSVKSLTIENQGEAELSFDIDILDEGMFTFAEKVARSNPFAQNATTVKPLKIPATRQSVPERLISGKQAYVAGVNALSTTLYATDFENFSEGDINGQQGWFGLYENWTISSEKPASDSLHFRGLSDGLGQSLAISPAVMIGEEEYSSMSAMIDLTGTGVSWNIAPQSTTAELVITRVYFNEDGSASALTAEGEDGAIVPIDAEVPEDYFELGIEVNRETFEFTVYFDEEAVFTGTGFAGDIENVAIVSNMEVAGPIFDMDDFAIFDGKLDLGSPVSWLSVNPEEGQVAPGSSQNIEVLFDATNLEPGVYGATIVVNSNDINNPEVTVPVQLTIKENKLKAKVFALLLINSENYHIIGTLEDGDVLDLAHLPTDKFNVVALTLPLKLGSVGFDLGSDDVDVNRIDNHLPYSLFELHQRVSAKEGNYSLTVTPYEKKNGKGKRGEEMEVNFEVINSKKGQELLTVYPNPFAHQISVNIPSQFTGSVKVTLLDKWGSSKVLGTHELSKDNRTFTYDMSRYNLRSGVDYYLRIEAVQSRKASSFYNIRSSESERSSGKPEIIRIIKQ